MARPKRSEQIDLKNEIIAAAWRQIARKGAPALTLRGIARSLKITAPAIYNYYPDRDALVTALIVDAFHSFGDALEAAFDGIPEADHGARLGALGLAYRAWAITHPERYQLIFGTPIAGYAAPLDVTVPAAARALGVLVTTLAEAERAGVLKAPHMALLSGPLQEMMRAWQEWRATDANPETLLLALSFWGRVHGLVSLELGNQFPAFITDPGEVYRREIRALQDEYFEGQPGEVRFTTNQGRAATS